MSELHKGNSAKEFYAYLKSNFSNLEEAKTFCRKWNREWDQTCRGFMDGKMDITMRSMAYHASMVLEGNMEDPYPDSIFTDYLKTKYGPELYWEM